MIEGTRRLSLVIEKRSSRLAGIFEFTQHEFVVADENWAGRISIIRPFTFINQTKLSQNVLNHDGRLAVNCGGCLRCGQVCNVTKPKNVRVLFMLQSVNIYVQKTISSSENRIPYKSRGSLRRNEMQKIELLLHYLFAV